MKGSSVQGIEQFIRDYPEMSIAPSHGSVTVLRGVFSFIARSNGGIEISDSYHLHIVVPTAFPREIPKVTEVGRKIPRDGNHHVNKDDNTLCLGSPIRLLKLVSEKPNLIGFTERCLVPYLYAISYKLQNEAGFPFGELAHGGQGVVDDYLNLFGLSSQEQVILTLESLGRKRRIANKGLCPCGCGRRLGICKFNRKLSEYRSLASRSWFRSHGKEIELQLMSRYGMKYLQNRHKYARSVSHGSVSYPDKL